MPDSNGKFRGIQVPELPWNRSGWSQEQNEDGTLSRTYHEPSGDRTVVLDPRAKDK